ncbi:MAG: ROK family transcriptional regulator [Verrucomicrobiota bacterium]
MKSKLRRIDLNNIRVARSETARDINRRIVLNLVRRHQPISRAAVARRSGMQRSTVSAITEQLIAQQWVREGAVGQLPRGRKPTFLHLNSERAGIIGVDIQPQITTLAVSSMDNRFLAQEQISTDADPAEFIARLGRRVIGLMRAYPKKSYEGIGVSLPGRIESSSHRLIFAPNLGWNDVDLKTPLEQATGLAVELENAANACALAEAWSGRYGEGIANLVTVTVSDGIGVGMIVNGQLARGSSGAAGEFGHVSLTGEGPRCRCGNYGCWEVLASNAAAVRYYAEFSSARKGEVGSQSDTARARFGDVLRLAEQGDETAGRALDQMARHLGAGIAMLVTGLAPDVLLVAGEVTRAWNRVGPIVTGVVQARCFTHANTRILPTDPEAQPRLQGTIALVLQKHFDAPFGV